DLREVQHVLPGRDHGQHLRPGHEVDLVQAEDHRPARLPQEVPHEAVAGAEGLLHVGQPQDHVALADALEGYVHHAPVEGMGGLVDPGGVEEHDLAVGAVDHGQDAVARGLRLVGDDRDLLAHQPVHERALPHVRPAHDRDEARPHAGLATAMRRKRTRLTRLRSASTTSTSKPRYSRRSPVRGTRPKSAVTNPPTVPTSSSWASEASSPTSSRSTFTRPATSTEPSGSTEMGSLSTSNSSLISPTSSSTMSSTVTSPAVPPYSSTTTANVVCCCCSSRRRSAILFVAGTTGTVRTS